MLTDVSHSSPAAPPHQAEDGELELTAPGPMAARWAALASELATDTTGIALIYRALDTLVEHFELNNAAVVIDEATLGRQAFSFGRQALDDREQLALARAPGLYTDPPLRPTQFDTSMLTTLCAVSLRLDLARDDASRGAPASFDDHPSRLGRPLAAGDKPRPVSLDDLELQLRKLPGVQSAAFSETDDAVFVHVYAGDGPAPGLATAAAHLPTRYFERPVTVELVRWRTVPAPTSEAVADYASSAAPDHVNDCVEPAGDEESIQQPRPRAIEPAAVVAHHATPARERRPERVKLVSILASPDTDELEVRVSWDGRQSVGRAPASRGLMGAVEATFEAVRAFADSLPFQPGWARTIETIWQTQFLVATAVIGPEHTAARYGLAAGDSPVEAAARSTLHALNRTLTGELHTNGQ